MKAPIETKVIAAASGAGLGGAAGTCLLWLLGVFFWNASAAADHATEAVAAVPQPVAALIVILVGSLGAAIGGYEAPHTDRPDLNAAPSAPAADPYAKYGGSVVPVSTTASTSEPTIPDATSTAGA